MKAANVRPNAISTPIPEDFKLKGHEIRIDHSAMVEEWSYVISSL